MTDFNKVVDDTSGYEGYKAQPYKDTRGLWTVGEGTCLETNPIGGKDWKYLLDMGMVTVSLSGAGARYLLRSKIAAELAELARTYQGFSALPDLAQTLLLEMAYQLGTAKLLTFTTFNNYVRSAQWARAAGDARTTEWYKQTPQRAEKILTQLEGI
jgi:GH24 family phage-related lysozyme (muramidase)